MTTMTSCPIRFPAHCLRSPRRWSLVRPGASASRKRRALPRRTAPRRRRAAPKPATPPLELDSLSWLDGCWRGTVNQHEFREQWLPLRGSLMLGIGSRVFQGKTQSYEYLRLETRPDGVYYVAICRPARRKPRSS